MNNSKIFELYRLKNRIFNKSHSNSSIFDNNNNNINENRTRKNVKEFLNNSSLNINEITKNLNKKDKKLFNMKNLSNAFLIKHNDNEFFPNLYFPNLGNSLLNLPLNYNIIKKSKN